MEEGVTAGEMEILLMVGGLDVDRGVEAKLVNIKEDNIGGGDGPVKSDRIVTVEVLKEMEKGIIAMGPQQENINKPEPKFRFRVI